MSNKSLQQIKDNALRLISKTSAKTGGCCGGNKPKHAKQATVIDNYINIHMRELPLDSKYFTELTILLLALKGSVNNSGFKRSLTKLLSSYLKRDIDVFKTRHSNEIQQVSGKLSQENININRVIVNEADFVITTALSKIQQNDVKGDKSKSREKRPLLSGITSPTERIDVASMPYDNTPRDNTPGDGDYTSIFVGDTQGSVNSPSGF